MLKILGSAQFDGKKIAVVGIGVSGRAVVKALNEHTRALISAWDQNARALEEVAQSVPDSRRFHCAEEKDLADALLSYRPDIAVIAPGFRERGAVWETLRRAGIPIWSEIELAWHLRPTDPQGNSAKWLCVTGTNGKTTTVSMLASIVKAAGLGHDAVGNIGSPAITEITRLDDAARVIVLELSSFQLAAVHSVSPASAAVLNFADDHLEWHYGRESYWKAKANIYNRVQCACVYPADDPQVRKMVDAAQVREGARAVGITPGIPQIGQIGMVRDPYTGDNVAVDRAFGKERFFSHKAVPELFTAADLAHLIPGGSGEGTLPVHLLTDALTAAALARSVGISAEHIRLGLRAYKPGAHRIELISRAGNINWIDDSKATNAHAALASLRMQKRHSTVWIVGGQAKGVDFSDLVSEASDRVGAVVVIGTDQRPWKKALAQLDVPTVYTDGDVLDPMPDAVESAARLAEKIRTEGTLPSVLLAPACASMDQFRSYAHRGDKFRRAVENYFARSAPNPLSGADRKRRENDGQAAEK